MRPGVKSLTTGLHFHTEVEGKRRHYYVVSCAAVGGRHSQVRLDLAIGDDRGIADMHLVAGRRGIWFLP